jgi:hypothetical protein
MIQSPLNRSRSDKFILILDIPTALKNITDMTLEETFKADTLQFSIFGSPVPPVTVPATDMAFGGQVYKTSTFSRPAYDPLNVRFLIDNGYKNYWLLWNWLNLLNDYKKSSSDAHTTNSVIGGIIENPMTEFTSSFVIYGLDEYNNKIISFKYTHAFPTQIGEISYSNQDPSEIISNVSFVFNRLEVDLEKNVDKIVC